MIATNIPAAPDLTQEPALEPTRAPWTFFSRTKHSFLAAVLDLNSLQYRLFP